MHGSDKRKIARIANSWVSGESIESIAKEYFGNDKIQTREEMTKAITDACKGIYKALANAGTWGLSALSKMPNFGIDYSAITPEDRRRLNLLPAMLYHGVRTEEGVLMRMNSVPRSAAELLGVRFATKRRSLPGTPVERESMSSTSVPLTGEKSYSEEIGNERS